MKNLVLLFLLFALPVFARPIKTGKLGQAVKASAKVASYPVRHPLKSVKATVQAASVSTYDTLEGAVDTLGIALQGFGQVFESVGQGLKAAPITVYLGDAVYYIGDGADYVGAYLAQ